MMAPRAVVSREQPSRESNRLFSFSSNFWSSLGIKRKNPKVLEGILGIFCSLMVPIESLIWIAE